ncbi:ImmA/IrrE family metallo-endopeptidase [Streptomyces sp. NRRL B-24085]|uniref:ImmA/IrrE family metallo-endopeptidase n=1 Tax=Streptomyces sp. NRRL B-24085 TaxID=1709476 RepID=UPI000A4E110F|nr:hypothetical protein [Streptomyces sp. NRRL B-24085]
MIKFSWEWESAPGVRLPEHKATWARIEIHAGGNLVTLVEDLDSGSSRRSIYAPLYPLAEWLAFNWWKLLYNSRLSRPELVSRFERTRLTDPEFLRNNFRRIGDGFAWPDLAIVPSGSQTTISWRPYSSPVANWKVRYLGQGEVVVSSADLQTELARIINSVISRLDECGLVATELHKEWAAVTGADAAEVEYCIAAARLGLDPYSEAHEFEDEIINSSQALASNMFDDFIDAVSPDRIHESLGWISRASATVDSITAPRSSRTAELRAGLTKCRTVATYRPWQMGWEQARIARQIAQVADTEPFALNDYVSAQELVSPEPRIQALGRQSGGGAALVIGSQQASSRTKNFLVGRALWHSVVDGDAPFLVTGAYTEKQKTERAFAAELLAPAAGIAALLDEDPWAASLESVERIADHFDVSAVLVQHQIDNQLAAV